MILVWHWISNFQVLQSGVWWREDFDSASESEALQVPHLPQETLHRAWPQYTLHAGFSRMTSSLPMTPSLLQNQFGRIDNDQTLSKTYQDNCFLPGAQRNNRQGAEFTALTGQHRDWNLRDGRDPWCRPESARVSTRTGGWRWTRSKACQVRQSCSSHSPTSAGRLALQKIVVLILDVTFNISGWSSDARSVGHDARSNGRPDATGHARPSIAWWPSGGPSIASPLHGHCTAGVSAACQSQSIFWLSLWLHCADRSWAITATVGHEVS